MMPLAPVRPLDSVLLLLCGVSLNLACELAFSLLKLPQSVIDEYQNSPVISMLSSNIFLSVLCVVLIIPAVEETVFRGLAFNRLRSGMGVVPALILQTILFAAAHIGNTLQSVYVLLAGLVLGLSYLWSKSLYGSILVHAAYNCTSLILLQLPESGAHLTFISASMFASPAVLIASLILLYRSSKQNPAGIPPAG
jgi:membrane protease YdiL (CAAX protease family)